MVRAGASRRSSVPGLNVRPRSAIRRPLSSPPVRAARRSTSSTRWSWLIRSTAARSGVSTPMPRRVANGLGDLVRQARAAVADPGLEEAAADPGVVGHRPDDLVDPAAVRVAQARELVGERDLRRQEEVGAELGQRGVDAAQDDDRSVDPVVDAADGTNAMPIGVADDPGDDAVGSEEVGDGLALAGELGVEHDRDARAGRPGRGSRRRSRRAGGRSPAGSSSGRPGPRHRPAAGRSRTGCAGSCRSASCPRRSVVETATMTTWAPVSASAGRPRELAACRLRRRSVRVRRDPARGAEPAH